MVLENINKYLQATSAHLGVEVLNYGGKYVAIIANVSTVNSLFSLLQSDDISHTEALDFLSENKLFPYSFGDSVDEAITKLNSKIGLLFEFDLQGKRYGTAVRRFELKAQLDADLDETDLERTWYDVSFDDIVSDLSDSKESYFYHHSKTISNDSVKRDLHAILNFKYEGLFANLNEFS